MASPTPNKGYTYPIHGGAVNAWDTPLNTNFDQIDLNVGGFYVINLGSTIAGATYNSSFATLSSSITTATLPSSIAQNMFFKVQGTISTNLAVTFPSGAGGFCFLNNVSSGAFSVSVNTGSSLTVGYAVPQGGMSVVAIDGVNAITDTNKASVPVTYSQIQTQAAGTLLGNVSSATAVPAPITIGAGITQTSSLNTISVLSFAPQASFKNLSVKVASNTTVTVIADFVTLTDGTNYTTVPVNATCNFGSAGNVNQLDTGTIAIDSWYYMWVISNGSTVGTLASLSATAPSPMPAGYTFKARVGAVKTVHGSAILYGTWQFGRRAQYVVGLTGTTVSPQIATGVAGNVNTPVWSGVTVNGGNVQQSFVPSVASAIWVYAATGNGGGQIMVAPNSNYGNIISLTNPPPMSMNGSAFSYSNPVNFLLEASTIQWANSDATASLYITGWEDNI